MQKQIFSFLLPFPPVEPVTVKDSVHQRVSLIFVRGETEEVDFHYIVPTSGQVTFRCCHVRRLKGIKHGLRVMRAEQISRLSVRVSVHSHQTS